MIVSHKHGFVFVKSKKTASTSMETYLSGFLGEMDIVCYVARYDERTRRELGGMGAQNFGRTTLELAPADFEEPRVYRKPRADAPLHFERVFYPHMPAAEIRERLGAGLWRRYFTFAFERNPWDKAVSAYFHRKQWQKLDLSFEEFLDRPARLPLNYPLYTDPADPSKVIVDKVYRYEEMPEALAELARRFGWPAAESLPVQAKSGHRPAGGGYRDHYSAETRNLVARHFQTEIDLFGYEF